MSFGVQELKRKARKAGIRASNSTLEAVVLRVETIQSAASMTRPATEDEAIALGLRFLMHSDKTGETAVKQALTDTKYLERVAAQRLAA